MPQLRRFLPLLAPPLLVLTFCSAISGAPFLPEEAARVLDPASPWHRLSALAPAILLSPETAARLPGAIAAGLTALLLVLAGRRSGTEKAAALLAATSPVLIAAGATVGPHGFAAAGGALAFLLLLAPSHRARAAGIALLVASALLPASPLLSPGPGRAYSAVLGAWGLFFGPAVPPWRLDVALPAIAAALVLLWIGSGSGVVRRAAVCAGLLAAAATLGLFSARPGLAPLAAAGLTPGLLLLVARGAARLPARVPRWPLVAIAVATGFIGLADLRLARDVLDPARRVAWDEAARMLAVLAEGDTAIASRPALPDSLRLYAPGARLGLVAESATLAEIAAHDRVLVVATGERGGLGGPTVAIERGLGEAGLVLKGELAMGELEPGLATFWRRLTGTAPADTFLRIRRYER